ncbi:unnamed protein product [Brachionus calyciflorus]|uniref:L-2-hydroxyglutarate dehydrogenase, mitochondrial n=1 Tax=Brachionus calyciflorus TaxID=104777 RepID=A0A813PI13_9BILA|nr:unnamed protein product [Brachionus calyciflorus]
MFKKNSNLIKILPKFYSTSTNNNYDVTIVGGGIVGLASARKLISDNPNLKFLLVEKENQLAFHQTGHNSGVIHAGIYYKPGSLKARLCVEGLEATYKYCDEHSIPYKKVGKLIVATNNEELSRLDDLFERGLKNNVRDLRMVSAKQIKEIEPNCVGLKAIHSPHTGIVDWGFVAKHFGMMFQKHGGKILLNFEADKFVQSTDPEYPLKIVSTNNVQINTRYLITCGGLYSDKLSEKSGCNPFPKIVPFRGDYLVMKPEKANIVRGNIYPVPDPKFPFLGVHFTPRMDGSVWLGPNAVLALKREGYKLLDFDFKDAMEELTFGGLRNMVMKNFKAGLGELYRGFSISATVQELRKFVPSLRVTDVARGPSGVRAQAMDIEGNLVDDFVFDSGVGDLGKRMLHVRNAPSPAATSSLAIANIIAQEVDKRFDLPKP